MTVKNINLGTMSSFKLFNKVNQYKYIGNPHYVLTLQLKERYIYEVEMTISNNKSSIERKFNISKLKRAKDMTKL